MTEQPSERNPGPPTSQLPTVEPQTIANPTVPTADVGSSPAPQAPPPPTSAPTTAVPVPVAASAPVAPSAPVGPVKPAKAVRRPLGALPALVPGILLSVVAIGIGVVGIHDALVYWTRSGSWDLIRVHGATWTGATIHWVESLTPQLWMTFVGAALALVGIWLIVIALKPRRVRGVTVTSSTYMWVEHSGVGRLAVAAAAQVPGVRSARGSAGRRTVNVTVEAGSGDSQQLATSVRDAIAARLAPLAKAPKITVSVKQPDVATPGSTP
jgi:Family of unknown function (DUF6286)